LHNKDQQDAFFIYFNNHPLHVANRLTIYHHQEVASQYVQHMVFIMRLRALTSR